MTIKRTAATYRLFDALRKMEVKVSSCEKLAPGQAELKLSSSDYSKVAGRLRSDGGSNDPAKKSENEAEESYEKKENGRKQKVGAKEQKEDKKEEEAVEQKEDKKKKEDAEKDKKDNKFFILEHSIMDKAFDGMSKLVVSAAIGELGLQGLAFSKSVAKKGLTETLDLAKGNFDLDTQKDIHVMLKDIYNVVVLRQEPQTGLNKKEKNDDGEKDGDGDGDGDDDGDGDGDDGGGNGGGLSGFESAFQLFGGDDFGAGGC